MTMVETGPAVATLPARTAHAIPSVWAMIREDVACVKARDPAARFTLEIVLTYPGVHAIIWQRLAHALWVRGRRFPARFLSWLGRFLTNVDIHPGATIGRRFFIDHGTGVVVGETAVIGDGVKLYQGVTLGALSVPKREEATKRHPTIEDDATIYAGATILGGDTVIGRGSTIGGNVWLTRSVAPGSKIFGRARTSDRPAASEEE